MNYEIIAGPVGDNVDFPLSLDIAIIIAIFLFYTGIALIASAILSYLISYVFRKFKPTLYIASEQGRLLFFKYLCFVAAVDIFLMSRGSVFKYFDRVDSDLWGNILFVVVTGASCLLFAAILYRLHLKKLGTSKKRKKK